MAATQPNILREGDVETQALGLIMKARIDAGTDVAMIGAWDAERDTTPFTAAETKRVPDALEADAAAGHLFLLRTGADGGGAIDLYIDEAIPAEMQQRLAREGGEFLLAIPSGQLVVGGAEDYRSAEPRITGPDSCVAVPAGDYSLRCYRLEDEEQDAGSEKELGRLVGKADLAYYDHTNRIGCVGGLLTLLLFPLLSFLLGWKFALPLTAVAFLSYFPVREWLLKRNARYQRLHKIVPVFRIKNPDPSFVFELRPIRDGARPRGGSVSLPYHGRPSGSSSPPLSRSSTRNARVSPPERPSSDVLSR